MSAQSQHSKALNVIAGISVAITLLGGAAAVAQDDKHDLPVEVTFRKALTCPGLVAVFRNYSGATLEAAAVFSSPSTGQSKQYHLVMNRKPKQIGCQEGWSFVPGQQITLRNENYRPFEAIVPELKQ